MHQPYGPLIFIVIIILITKASHFTQKQLLACQHSLVVPAWICLHSSWAGLACRGRTQHYKHVGHDV